MDRTTIERIDDMDGKSHAAERIRFAFDSKRYVIDLTADHAAELRAKIAPYLTAARRDDSAPAVRPRGNRSASAASERNADIRQWAAGQGIKVSSRGQVPADVAAKYDAAHASPQSPAGPASPARSAGQPAPAATR